MAQTIKLKRKTDAAGIPSTTDIVSGEPAVNTVAGKLYIKDNENIIVDVASNIIDVTVSSAKFFFNGVRPDDLVLQKGQTYLFRQSDSTNSGNSLKIGTTVEYVSASTYGVNDGVTEQTEAIEYIPAFDAPNTVYIHSLSNSGYGVPINFASSPVVEPGHSSLNEGLIAHYPLAEGSGKVSDRSSRNGGEHELEDGADHFEVGGYRCIDFDAEAGASINIGMEDAFNSDLGFSASAWVYVDSYVNHAGVIGKNHPDQTSPYSFMLTIHGSGQISVYDDNAWYYGDASKPVPLSTWALVTWSYDGTTIRGYVNGDETLTQASVYFPNEPTYPIRIGGWHTAGNSYDINGKIRDVRIWDRPISTEEVSELMTAPHANTAYTHSQVSGGVHNTGTVSSVATGGGLTGGPVTSTGTISHSDTSTQASIDGSGRTYIQDVTLDGYGHVTGLATATETVTNTNTQRTDGEIEAVIDKDHVEGLGIDSSSLNNDASFATTTQLDNSYVSSHHVNAPADGWYTIATNTGNRAVARFAVWDTSSGDHQAAIFYASHHYGQNSSNAITVLTNSYYSGSNIRYIRIKDGGTYDGAALQVYLHGGGGSHINQYCAIVGDNVQSASWVLKDWIPDATDPGDLTNYSAFVTRGQIDLDQIGQGGMITTGPVFAGGDTTQYEVIHTNNIDSHAVTSETHSTAGYVTSSGVTSVATGSGLTGGPVTSTGTISHSNTSDVGNVDNSGNNFIQDLTFDAFGHVTAVTSAEASGGGGNVDLTEVTTNIIPASNAAGTLDIGTLSLPFKDIYLTEDSLHLGAEDISVSNGELKVSDKKVATYDDNGNITITGTLSFSGGGSLSGGAVLNSPFTGTTTTTKEINYTHITPASPVDPDPYWDDVELLLRGLTTDESSFPRHTLFGLPATTDGSGKWGEGYDFDGSVEVIGDDTIFNFGSGDSSAGDFTIQFWIYNDDWSVNKGIVDTRTSSGHNSSGFYLGIENSQILWHHGTDYFSGVDMTDSEWQFVHVSRDDGSLKIYIDGVLGATHSITTDYSRTTYKIGNHGFVDIKLDAKIDDFRVTKAVRTDYAKPTKAMVAPTITITSNDTHFDKVEVLLQGGDDLSKNTYALSAGSIDITSSGKFGVGYNFDDAADDTIFIGGDANVISLEDKDFTAELWYKRTGTGDYDHIWGISNAAGNEDLGFRFDSNNTLTSYFRTGSTNTFANTGWTDSEWHHIAMERYGTTITIYKDGTALPTTASVGTDSYSSPTDSRLSLGSAGLYNAANWAHGVIDDFRITVGVARYQGNFTLPTELPSGSVTSSWGSPQIVETGTAVLPVPTGSVYYNEGNVGIGTDAPISKLDVAGAIQQQSKYASENDMRTKVDTDDRFGTTGVIGNDLHYVDAAGNLQETMRVDVDTADASTYTGFNITTNITQTQQTGWGVGGNTVQTGTTEPTQAGGDEHWENVGLLVTNTGGLVNLKDDSTITNVSASTTTGNHHDNAWDFSNAYLYGTGSELTNMGVSDIWTIEGWINGDEWGWVQRIFSSDNFHFGHGSAYGNVFHMVKTGGGYAEWNFGGTMTMGVWNHIAFVKESDLKCRVWINGTQTGSAHDASSTNFNFATSRFGSRTISGGEYWNGQMEEWRITLNVARYQAGNTYTSAPFEVGPLQEETPGVPIYGFVPDGSIYYDDGNVGLGTTAPNYQLDVQGNINSSGEILQNGQPLMTQDDVPKQYWLPFDETYGVGDTTTGDDHYNDVSLLMHMNGADGTTTFEDHSKDNHAIAQAGTIVDDVQPTAKIEAGTSAFTQSASLNNGLIHVWNFSDNLNDLKGSNNLTYGGGSESYSTSVGVEGNKSVDLTDSNYLSTTTNYASGKSTLSQAMWVYVDDNPAGNRGFVSTRTQPDLQMSLDLTSSGQLAMYMGSSKTADSGSTALPLDQWVHLVWVIDGTNGTIYMNGTSVGSGAFSATLVTNTQTMYMFRRADDANAHMDGYMAQLGVWDRALTTTEITELYNSGAGIEYDTGETNSIIVGYGIINTPANLSKYGNAMGDFTTDKAYLSVADHAGFNFGTGDFTAEAWLKPVDVNITTTVTDPHWDDVKFLLNAGANPGASNIASETGDVGEDVAGRWGSDDGYIFDGNDRYNTDLLLPSSNWTIEGWFKPTGGTAYQYLISSHVGSGTNYEWRAGFISYQSSDKRFYAEIQDGGWQTITQANDAAPLNEWYFVRTVYDGAKVEFYVDGELIGSFNSTSHLGNGLPLIFGGSSSGNHFTGSMSDVRYTTAVRTDNTTVPTAALGETTSGTVVGAGGGGVFQLGSDSLKLDVSNSKVRVQNNTATLVTGTTDLTSNTWHHVAVSRQDGDLKAFLGGIQEGSTVVSSTHDFNSNNLLNVGKIAAAEAYVIPEVPGIVEDDIVFNINANNTDSYSGSGTSIITGAGAGTMGSGVGFNGEIDAKYFSSQTDVAGSNIAITYDSSTNFGHTNSFSMDCWVRATTTYGEQAPSGSTTWAILGDNTGGQTWAFGYAGGVGGFGVPKFSYYGNSGWQAMYATTNIGDGEWHHIAFTTYYSGGLGKGKWYVDGVAEIDAGTGSGGDPNFPTNWVGPNNGTQIKSAFGGYGGNAAFILADVSAIRVYDVTLSAADVAQNYSAGKFSAGPAIPASSGVDSVDSFWSGYMDEFRITKGTGRYSATFPVPVQEFGNQKPLVIGDQSYNSVSLSTHMNGLEGGQVFTDSSPNTHTITVPAESDVHTKTLAAGSTSSSTVVDPNKDSYWDNVSLFMNENIKFVRNGNSVLLDGVTETTGSEGKWGEGFSFDGANDFIDTNTNMPYLGEFSLEFWMKPSSTTTGTVFSQYDGNINDRFVFQYLATGGDASKFDLSLKNPSGSWLSLKTSANYPHSNWYFCRFERISGGDLKFYVDGTLAGTITYNSSWTLGNNQNLIFGKHNHGSPIWYGGIISDIRLTQGLYRTDYTKPTEAMAAPTFVTETVTDANWANTVLLVQSNNQDTENTFVDTGGSSTTHILSQSGGAIHSGDTAKFGTSSIKFDGVDDFITVPAHADFNLGTEDFTAEMWVNIPTSYTPPGYWPQLFSIGSGDGNEQTGTFGLWIIDSTGTGPIGEIGFLMNSDDNTRVQSGTDIRTGLWTHVAVTREDGVFKLWQGGMLRNSLAYSMSINASANSSVIFRSNQSYLEGYMEDFRITKGVARYNSDFSLQLPSTPYGETYTQYKYENGTPAEEVKLLIRGSETITNNSFTESSDSEFTVTLTDATLENGSFKFDGTGDKLTVAEHADLNFDGDFTVETWVYFIENDCIIMDNRSAQNTGSFTLYVWDERVYTYIGGADRITSPTNAIANNRWHHIAVSRTSGAIKMFVDGAQSGSTWTDSRTIDDTDWIFGKYALGSEDLNGYMDNIRFTKGVGLYTGSFTPKRQLDVETTTWNLTTETTTAAYTPKFGIASAVFDGDGDKLTVAANDSFTFAAGEDYTIEGWIKTEQVGVSSVEVTTSITPTTYNDYNIYSFTASGNQDFTVGSNSTVDILVVAGGGAGGSDYGAGGGAGGLIYIENYPLTAGTYTVNVGAGGAGVVTHNVGNNGVNTTFGNGTTTLTALGGGGGGAEQAAGGGSDGGSGGGSDYNPGGQGTATQVSTTNDGVNDYLGSGFGYAGGEGVYDPHYNPGGGGGAGGIGESATTAISGDGGVGKDFSAILGTGVGDSGWFAGGGGGGQSFNGGGDQGAGGQGGGGIGGTGAAHYSYTAGSVGSGVANTGGGGGGMMGDLNTGPASGDGGSGVVIIRILTAGVGTISSYPSIITTGTASLELGVSGYVAGCESVSGTKNYITSTAVVNDDEWHHVAISRNTGITRLFVDGVLQASTRTSTEEFVNSGVTIGSDASDNDYSGSMDDIRITKGVGRYTENFPKPVLQNGDVLQVGDVIPVTDDIYYTGGKVGFGATNPDYQVDVTGSVNSTGGFYESGAKVENFKQTDAGDAQYDGNVEVTGELKVDSWTIKEEGGNLILVKSDGTKYNINLTAI